MNWSDANGTAVARVPMFVANLMLLGMGIFLYFRSAHSAGDDFAE
jgi:hypothetical protein